MKNLILVFVVLLFVPCVGYGATSKSEIREMLVQIKKIMRESKNVSQVAKTTSTDERRAGQDSSFEAMYISAGMSSLTDLLSIENQMTSSEDAKVVHGYIQLQRKQLKEDCEVSAELLNISLAELKNPALISETKSLRDEVSKGCDLMLAH